MTEQVNNVQGEMGNALIIPAALGRRGTGAVLSARNATNARSRSGPVQGMKNANDGCVADFYKFTEQLTLPIFFS